MIRANNAEDSLCVPAGGGDWVRLQLQSLWRTPAVATGVLRAKGLGDPARSRERGWEQGGEKGERGRLVARVGGAGEEHAVGWRGGVDQRRRGQRQAVPIVQLKRWHAVEWARGCAVSLVLRGGPPHLNRDCVCLSSSCCSPAEHVLLAIIPIENSHCSCKLTRGRHQLQ